jgi:hypothetical protein
LEVTAVAGAMPSNWAGGAHVCVPGLGVGRIILDEPRVIEIDLPSPDTAVFLTSAPTPRAVVLVDPRVPYERAVLAIAAARVLEENAAADALTMPVAVGDDTPPGGLPLVTARPHLTLVQGGAVDPCCGR